MGLAIAAIGDDSKKVKLTNIAANNFIHILTQPAIYNCVCGLNRELSRYCLVLNAKQTVKSI